ncbi:MAG: nicotinate phosphoribosyltransferase, partial [Candidatus Dormibacteraeota bacterium]|nr:nicotinate phosphoribosyltransferase [Candidatus Dormibacteraeota bacterium]
MTPFLSDLLEYYGGPAADVYFHRAEATLAGAGLDPVVGMEFFCDRPGVLCGVKEAVGVLEQTLAKTDEIWALDDGDTMAAQEVVLRVRAPYSHFGRYETALLG